MYLSDNRTALILLGSVRYIRVNTVHYVCTFLTCLHCKNLGIVNVLCGLYSSRCAVNGYLDFSVPVIWAIPVYIWLLITESQQPKACGLPLNSRFAIINTQYCNILDWMRWESLAAAKHWGHQNQKQWKTEQSVINNSDFLIQTQCFIIKIIKHNCIINSVLSCLILIKDVLNLNAIPS